MGRLLNFLVAVLLIIILSLPIILIYLVIKLTSRGPAIYWSKRIGKGNKIFEMPKFRSMKIDTPEVASHLLEDNSIYLTPVGAFIRKTSIDELPQLISIIKGEMAFVGPRPALFNQTDLIELRKELGVDKLMPGITGLAQVRGRDELSISQKVNLDLEYMKRRSIWFDFKIVISTIIKVMKSEGVSH
jgi:O-antigen biosynthesis protein WbqP